MAVLNLEIITPSKSVFSGEINSITVPGTLGSFQVLKNHAPIISSLEIGSIKVVDSQGKTILYRAVQRTGTTEISK